MPQYKLTKAELAALDLLIAQMQEDKDRLGETEYRYTPVLARVTRTLTNVWRRRIVTTTTPTITTVYPQNIHTPNIRTMTDYPVGARDLGELAVEAAAADILPNLSLEELIQMRRQVVLEREAPVASPAASKRRPTKTKKG